MLGAARSSSLGDGLRVTRRVFRRLWSRELVEESEPELESEDEPESESESEPDEEELESESDLREVYVREQDECKQ